MDHIEETKRMMLAGLAVVANPNYLDISFADKSVGEIKSMQRDGNDQLPIAAQQELSLRGDRLALIEFHRFLFYLADVDLKRLWNAKKHFWAEKRLGDNDSSYCDVNLLQDAVQYQLCLRDDKQFDQMIADQIARSFKFNLKLASDFPEITSQHMINFARNLLNDYSKKAADFQRARQLLGLSQAALSKKLGWSTVKQISNIETGARPAQKQTELAIECLLRREKKWSAFQDLGNTVHNSE